jgi:hypothetical protein
MESDLLLSIFVAVEGAHAFSAFMPSAFTIQKFAVEDGDRGKLRAGYGPAILFNLLLAGSVSAMVKSVRPFIAALLVIGFMLVMYEQALSPQWSVK